MLELEQFEIELLNEVKDKLKKSFEENLPDFKFEKETIKESDYGDDFDKNYSIYFFRRKYGRIDSIGIHTILNYSPADCSYTFTTYDTEGELVDHKEQYYSKEDFELTKEGLAAFFKIIKKQNSHLFKFKKWPAPKTGSIRGMDEQRVISILDKNRTVLHGAFTMIENTFPPREILNDFLLTSNDACDQDSKMAKWKSFSLLENSYSKVFNWWKEIYHQAKIKSLGSTNWSE